jgi:hypothetical protein
MSFLGNILHSKVEYEEIPPRLLKPQNDAAHLTSDMTAAIETLYPNKNDQKKLREAFSGDIQEWSKKGGHVER